MGDPEGENSELKLKIEELQASLEDIRDKDDDFKAELEELQNGLHEVE